MIFGVFDMGAGTLLLTDALRRGRWWPEVVARAVRCIGRRPPPAWPPWENFCIVAFSTGPGKNTPYANVGTNLKFPMQSCAGLVLPCLPGHAQRPVSAVTDAAVAGQCRSLRRHAITGIKKAQPFGCAHASTDGRETSANALPHFTSNCCGMPAALPSTMTSAVYLPAGQPLGLVNSMLVVPASVVLSATFCSPATCPSW